MRTEASVPTRAVQYVRMSTDLQRYSTENQAEAIAAYAARRDFEIVRTYADEGRSGLNIAGRDSLRELIADIQAGRADYGAVLVYDLSRWGASGTPTRAPDVTPVFQPAATRDRPVLSCYPFLDHLAGRHPASAGSGGPCAADRFTRDIGVLLPIALCGLTSL